MIKTEVIDRACTLGHPYSTHDYIMNFGTLALSTLSAFDVALRLAVPSIQAKVLINQTLYLDI